MRPIGGYFELELPRHEEYHARAIKLNTGRNALEYILRVRGYRHVFIPFYSCEVILEPFKKLGVNPSYYAIDQNLELSEDITLAPGEALLAINYFGLKQDYIQALAERYADRLIVDNTQAFYARPIDGIDTFYSCRKYFGVSDGAYLYCDKPIDTELEQDCSWARMDYLLKRIDLSPEDGYRTFRARSRKLVGQPIRLMSPLTRRIMCAINYDTAASQRRENYRTLNKALHDINGISLPLSDEAVPMVYPLLTEDKSLRKKLIESGIYVAQYWPNVAEDTPEDRTEGRLARQLLPLPVDQRYDHNDMERVISITTH